MPSGRSGPGRRGRLRPTRSPEGSSRSQPRPEAHVMPRSPPRSQGSPSESERSAGGAESSTRRSIASIGPRRSTTRTSPGSTVWRQPSARSRRSGVGSTARSTSCVLASDCRRGGSTAGSTGPPEQMPPVCGSLLGVTPAAGESRYLMCGGRHLHPCRLGDIGRRSLSTLCTLTCSRSPTVPLAAAPRPRMSRKRPS